uniref:Uncharacterized protein n=1 Tax=Anopheles merus TaxID=30066 RepID=A0A182URK1_ANOME
MMVPQSLSGLEIGSFCATPLRLADLPTGVTNPLMTATVNPVIKVPVLEKPLNSVPVVEIGSAAHLQLVPSARAINGAASAGDTAVVSSRSSSGNHF